MNFHFFYISDLTLIVLAVLIPFFALLMVFIRRAMRSVSISPRQINVYTAVIVICVFGIPIVQSIVSTSVFREYCSSDGGVVIYKPLVMGGVLYDKSFRNDVFSDNYIKSRLDLGLNFIEMVGLEKKYRRYFLNESGKLKHIESDEIKSSFMITSHGWQQKFSSYVDSDISVSLVTFVDISTGELIAHKKNYIIEGTIIDQQFNFSQIECSDLFPELKRFSRQTDIVQELMSPIINGDGVIFP
jgi:hypothetical protein